MACPLANIWPYGPPYEWTMVWAWSKVIVSVVRTYPAANAVNGSLPFAQLERFTLSWDIRDEINLNDCFPEVFGHVGGWGQVCTPIWAVLS